MISESSHRFLVAYDVADDARRTRVAKTLESYGDRIQYSVFLVQAKPAKLLRMKAAVEARIDLAADSVLFCDLGPSGHDRMRRIDFIGLQRGVTSDGPLVF